MARAKRARAHVALLLALITAVVLAYAYRDRLFGLDLPVRVACVLALVILGWAFAMNLGRAAGPMLMRRLEPGTAGTVGFLIRLATLVLTVLVALRLAGLDPETPAVGGAITAVMIGLAAQQTVGNLIAGTASPRASTCAPGSARTPAQARCTRCSSRRSRSRPARSRTWSSRRSTARR